MGVLMTGALHKFANHLDERRPSSVQLQISPEYNKAVVATLEWAASEARKWAAPDEMEWQPIATAPVPPREVLKHGTWPCLLQDRKGVVTAGYAAYVKDRLGPNPDRTHKRRPPTYRIQWYHGLRAPGRAKVFVPIYWMPMPAPRGEP